MASPCNHGGIDLDLVPVPFQFCGGFFTGPTIGADRYSGPISDSGWTNDASLAFTKEVAIRCFPSPGATSQMDM